MDECSSLSRSGSFCKGKGFMNSTNSTHSGRKEPPSSARNGMETWELVWDQRDSGHGCAFRGCFPCPLWQCAPGHWMEGPPQLWSVLFPSSSGCPLPGLEQGREGQQSAWSVPLCCARASVFHRRLMAVRRSMPEGCSASVPHSTHSLCSGCTPGLGV